jgi:hypothetical protein
MPEWVLADGFLEQVIRNEQVPFLLFLVRLNLFISPKPSRSSAPALHCSPGSPARADPPGVSAEVPQ